VLRHSAAHPTNVQAREHASGLLRVRATAFSIPEVGHDVNQEEDVNEQVHHREPLLAAHERELEGKHHGDEDYEDDGGEIPVEANASVWVQQTHSQKLPWAEVLRVDPLRHVPFDLAVQFCARTPQAFLPALLVGFVGREQRLVVNVRTRPRRNVWARLPLHPVHPFLHPLQCRRLLALAFQDGLQEPANVKIRASPRPS
jgi:hypothetical protein